MEKRFIDRLIILVDNFDGFIPCLLLRIRYFTKIQHGLFNVPPVGDLPLLNDAVILIYLAVLLAFIWFQVHTHIIAHKKYHARG